jgi:hypothetical protein
MIVNKGWFDDSICLFQSGFVTDNELLKGTPLQPVPKSSKLGSIHCSPIRLHGFVLTINLLSTGRTLPFNFTIESAHIHSGCYKIRRNEKIKLHVYSNGIVADIGLFSYTIYEYMSIPFDQEHSSIRLLNCTAVMTLLIYVKILWIYMGLFSLIHVLLGHCAASRKSQVWFQMALVSLIDLIFPAALWPWGRFTV